MDEVFSQFYREAREKFVAMAKAHGGKLSSHRHPLRGAMAEPLYCDVALFGNQDAANRLMIVSGVHGVEGYCGSGSQIGWLKKGGVARLSDKSCVVMVHALNPWGFSYDTRTTEDGSDLCRNFVDFAKPLPEHAEYDAIADDLVPEDWFGQGKQEADARLKAVEAEAGLQGLVATIARGQYRHPFGPFYGGFRRSWSNLLFEQIIADHLAGAQKIACIDYHTGLGPPGIGQLLLFHPPGSQNETAAKACWGDRAAQTATGESVAYQLTGSILGFLENQLPNTRVIAGAYEFGTVPPEEVFLYGLRGDRWLAKHADLASAEAAELRRRVRAAFYLETSAWKSSVLEQAIWAHDRAIEYMQGG